MNPPEQCECHQQPCVCGPCPVCGSALNGCEECKPNPACKWCGGAHMSTDCTDDPPPVWTLVCTKCAFPTDLGQAGDKCPWCVGGTLEAPQQQETR